MSDREKTGQRASLSDYINQNQYAQQIVADPNVIETGGQALADALNGEQDSSSEVGNVNAVAAPGTQESAPTNAETPDPEAVKRLEEFESRERALATREQELNAQADRDRQAQAQAALRREEALFGQHLQSLETDDEKRAATAEFKLMRANRERDYYREQAANQEKSSNETREQIAKNQVIFAVMREQNIPDEFRPFLEKAQTVEEFEALVTNAKALASRFAPATETPDPTQLRTERVQSGVDIAGGTNAGFVPPKEVKERSGDIAGLISGRGYQVMNAYQEPTN